MIVWLKFALCASALIYAGYKLSYYGNIISEKTNLTKSLMGFFFLSLATSLPEFVTSGSSASVFHSADLALGDLFGTIIINLMIIALLDLIQGKGALMIKAKQSHILCIALTVILLTCVSFSVLLRKSLNSNLTVLGMGAESWLLIFIFLIGLKLIWGMERREGKTSLASKQSSPLKESLSLRRSVVGFSLSFLAIVFLGIWLAAVASEIVEIMDWSETLVGTFLLGLVTSLPELIVSISALRFNVDMAIGNILGSNFFDLMIIPLCDSLLGQSQIFSLVNSSHLFTLTLAVLMNSILIVGLIYRSSKSFLKMGWEIIAMTVTFAAGTYFLFSLG